MYVWVENKTLNVKTSIWLIGLLFYLLGNVPLKIELLWVYSRRLALMYYGNKGTSFFFVVFLAFSCRNYLLMVILAIVYLTRSVIPNNILYMMSLMILLYVLDLTREPRACLSNSFHGFRVLSL